jgi:hypothetical protein
MKWCSECQQQNQDDSNFCYQCGNQLASSTEPSLASRPFSHPAENDLWRDFIGPNADRYLEQFKKFGSAQSPRFALTWNWIPFLLIGGCSFLWFLYRKMYLYAAVYALGPVVSVYLTGDFTSGVVWNVGAGATANYVYYLHCREHIASIKQRAWNDPGQQQIAIKEEGGVQPYVIWVGVVMYVLFSLMMFKMLQEGAFELDDRPGKPSRPAGSFGVSPLALPGDPCMKPRPILLVGRSS